MRLSKNVGLAKMKGFSTETRKLNNIERLNIVQLLKPALICAFLRVNFSTQKKGGDLWSP